MKDKVAIRVEALGKKYRLNQRKQGTLRDTFTEFWKYSEVKKRNDFWALKDVSFEISRGSIVGVIGRNGAGKSTLLKILSRITPPTTGRIELNGRVASLLEVGTGFHHELTGRENIFLNGTILGMTRSEIKNKFDEIVAFSGVEKFLDTPVKHYSSGMYVRLAFAVAAHLEAEILLIDEVLAVGDAAFQKKCLGKIDELTNSGRTVLIVSHNMSQIQKLCSSTILIENGCIDFIGNTDKALKKYEQLVKEAVDVKVFEQQINKEMYFSYVSLLNSYSEPVNQLHYGEPFSIELALKSSIDIENIAITIEATRHTGEWVFSSISSHSKELFSLKADKIVKVVAYYENIVIRPGTYTLHLSIAEGISNRYYNLVLNNFFQIDDIPYRNNLSYEGYWGLIKVFPLWKSQLP